MMLPERGESTTQVSAMVFIFDDHSLSLTCHCHAALILAVVRDILAEVSGVLP